MQKLSDNQARETILKGESLENYIVDSIDLFDLSENESSLNIRIIDCKIKSFYLTASTFGHIFIDNCKIDHIAFIGAFFPKGFLIQDSHIMNESQITAGGYNLSNSEIVIRNNVFEKGVTFRDCSFKGPFSLINNQFKEGTDILYKTQLAPSFEVPPVIEGNKGDLKKQIISD